MTILAGTPTLERWRSVQLIWFKAFTAGSTWAHRVRRRRDQGYLFAHGDQGAGYGLYRVLDGRPAFVHNDGRGHLRRLDGARCQWRHLGGRGLRGAGRQRLDGLAVGRRRGPGSLEGVPMLFGMAPFEGITVGRDPAPVDWDLHRRFGSFA